MNDFVPALITSLMFAAVTVATKDLSATVPVLLITLSRYAISAGSLLFFIDKKNCKKFNQQTLMLAIALGLLSFSFNMFFTSSLSLTFASTTALIMATHPIVTLSVVSLFTKKMPTRWQIASFIFSFIGVAFVITQGNFSAGLFTGNVGEFLALGAMLSQVAYTLVLRQVRSDLSPQRLMTVVGFITMLGALPLCYGKGLLHLFCSYGSYEWLLLLFIGTFGTALALSLFTLSVRRIGPPMTSLLVFSTMPIFVFLLSYFLLDECITQWHIMGSVLVISSLFLSLKVKKK